MTFFPDLSTFVTIGSLSIKWYAVLILTGAFIAYWISQRNILKMGYPASLTDDLFFGALIAGIIGARLWYVLFYNLEGYLKNPLSIFMTWEGGMAIQGGLMLGALYAFFFLKKRKISFLRMADAIVPNILIAQAIGRWGNFLNQEAYGYVVSESYYKFFPAFIKNTMFIGGQYRTPTFLYESVLNLVGFFLIAIVLKRFSENKRGDLLYAYLMWYGFIRFWVEGLRSDSLMFMGFRTAQLLSILYLLIGVAGKLGLLRRFYKQPKPILLFDLDGTLLDTEPLIIESMTRVLKKYRPDVTVDRETGISFLGPTLTQSLSRFLKEEEIPEAFEMYRTINRDLHKDNLQPIEHAPELIKALKEQGYTLGIVSSKKKDMVEYGLEVTQLKAYFDVIIGYDEVTAHKPDPQGILKACEALKVGHDDVVYVGDTYTDIAAAHNAGVYSIAYMTHPERQDAIHNEKPNAKVTDLLEILDLLKQDISWTNSLT